MKTTPSLVPGSIVIAQLCNDLGYTRPHIANILRRNAATLKAKRMTGRWFLPRASIRVLSRLVKDGSGRRYKLKETGGHRTKG